MSRDKHNPFIDLAKEYAKDIVPSLVGGWRVLYDRTTTNKGAPSPFGTPLCPTCQDEMHSVAQFWHWERLWSVCFCDCDMGDITVRSVLSDASLMAGSSVVGNSSWRLEPCLYVPNLDTPEWSAVEAQLQLNAIIMPLNMWQFHEALAKVLECDNYGSDTHLEGQANWIQNDDTPTCPDCQKPMTLLVQLEEPDVVWGDSGALYVFACKEHPHQTWSDGQMC